MKHRRRASSLRAQIFTRTLVVGLVPLALLAVVAVLGLRTLEQTADRGVASSRQSLGASTVTARLESESEAAAREIDLVLAERINDVVTWSRQPSVIEGAEAAAQLASANGLVGLDAEAAEARFQGSPSLGAAPLADAFLAAEMERRGQFIDISFTDRNGFNAGIVGTAQDFVQSDEAWWQSAWDNGVYVGGVTLHPESNAYVIPISSRIENAQGTRVGVLRASLSLAFVQTVADAHTDDDISLVVVTAARELLAETATGHDPARIGSPDLTDADFSSGALVALESGDGSLINDDAVYGFTRVESTRGAVDRDDQVDRFDWFIISSQPTSTAFAPLDGLEELNDDLERAGRQLSLITLAVLILSCIVAAGAAAILSRKLVRPIKMLTEGARRAADHDLPLAVARMQDENHGIGTIDDTTIEISAGNELQELASSFNSVQRTAISLAAEQARQRKTTAEMFANLGRRNQSLVKRQLRFIEQLEQSEEDPDRLSSLFRLDHLATRMRRNAESLLVIAGHRSATRRSNPVRIELVAQAALGEVEDFERVNASSIEPAALMGRTVADVAHVLAELIENALTFSPPEAPVAVTGKSGPTHYTLSVIDRGIGLSPDELEGVNERLTIGAGVDLTSSKQLGLLVVSKLAARHSLEVSLSATNAGGISAEVLIPNGLIQPSSSAPRLPTQTRSAPEAAATATPATATPATASMAPPAPSPAPVQTPAPSPAPAQTPTPSPATAQAPTQAQTQPQAAVQQTSAAAQAPTPGPVSSIPPAPPTAPVPTAAQVVPDASTSDDPATPDELGKQESASHPATPVDATAAPVSDVASVTGDTGQPAELEEPVGDDADGPEPVGPVEEVEIPDETVEEAADIGDMIDGPEDADPIQAPGSFPSGGDNESLAAASALRRKDDLSPSVVDNVFRAPGITSQQPMRPQSSDDPTKQRRVSDAGFSMAPAESERDASYDGGFTDDAVLDEGPGQEVHGAESDLQQRRDEVVADDSSTEGERYIGSLSSKSVAQISSIKRRESRRPGSGASPKSSGAKPKRAVAITDSVEEVSQEAEKLRNRWSSFQNGRRQAAPQADDLSQERDGQEPNDE